MNAALARLMLAGNGIVTRGAALRELPAHVWTYAVAAGHLVPLFPGVAVDPALAGDPSARCRAALAYAGPGAALSHTSALAVWGLPAAGDHPVHVTTGPGRRLRAAGIIAHRQRGFVAEPPQVLIRNGLPVTRLEWSLVDAWPLTAAADQRAPVLRAVAERLTTPDRIATALAGAPRLPGRQELHELLGKLAAGCHSELELYGHDHVFTGPGMPQFERQVRLRLGDRSIYMDVYDPVTRTNFELDGAASHSSPAARERDIRRDAALAARGILVVRFSHDRLVREPERVRQEVLAILAARAAAIA